MNIGLIIRPKMKYNLRVFNGLVTLSLFKW